MTAATFHYLEGKSESITGSGAVVTGLRDGEPSHRRDRAGIASAVAPGVHG